ncbi:hypothetical protein DYBT9275_05317 [Dyadobacter sp. CECT 9275]|uniref:HTH cro/C1-type domain-containing protein n=1 Tax=Dyadobacter helix TaxID=2822344 RepID=A0A916JGX7_9BACT|nr:helix-turn-helix transcriptional regulator [Dyadobacter sp. CECT 9275]CAG5013015.1 hypothetical protein DYBT9275_05317 [Dyadobacter sp. CECT 9275]
MSNNEENTTKLTTDSGQKLFQEKLGAYLSRLRKASGYDNAYDFAIAINITESQYGAYERGERDIRLSTLRKILLGNNINLEDLLLPNSIDGDKIDSALIIKGNERRMEQVRKQVEIQNGKADSIALGENDIDRIIKILIYCIRPRSKKDILDKLMLSNTVNNFNRVAGLVEKNQWIAKTTPESPNNPKQQYYTTENGKRILNMMN